MPTQEAIEALLKLRQEQQQNSQNPFTFTGTKLGQGSTRTITGETEQETEDRIEKDKVSLFQSVLKVKDIEVSDEYVEKL